jgi:hypothetical protein
MAIHYQQFFEIPKPLWHSVLVNKRHLKTALKMALVVGLVLILINQGDRILNGPWDRNLLWKLALTPLVPFLVSYFSSYLASRQQKSLQAELKLCQRELAECREQLAQSGSEGQPSVHTKAEGQKGSL